VINFGSQVNHESGRPCDKKNTEKSRNKQKVARGGKGVIIIKTKVKKRSKSHQGQGAVDLCALSDQRCGQMTVLNEW